MSVIVIPRPFQRELSLVQRLSHLTEKTAPFEKIIQQVPFYFDLEGALAPWNERETYVPLLFSVWQKLLPTLEACYEDRDVQRAKGPMLLATAAFIDALFWTNEQPVERLIGVEEDANELAVKPVNIEERLAFLLAAPNKYHSFVQLRAMMDELRKMYAKSVALAKVKKR